jgi:hypothetical protein
MILQPGTCRHCHCMESDPCTLANGDPCTLDQFRLVCSSPACFKAEARRIAAARPKPPTSSDIHRLIAGRKGPKRARPAKIRANVRR